MSSGSSCKDFHVTVSGQNTSYRGFYSPHLISGKLSSFLMVHVQKQPLLGHYSSSLCDTVVAMETQTLNPPKLDRKGVLFLHFKNEADVPVNVNWSFFQLHSSLKNSSYLSGKALDFQKNYNKYCRLFLPILSAQCQKYWVRLRLEKNLQINCTESPCIQYVSNKWHYWRKMPLCFNISTSLFWLTSS